jgi:hypothetical protein
MEQLLATSLPMLQEVVQQQLAAQVQEQVAALVAEQVWHHSPVCSHSSKRLTSNVTPLVATHQSPLTTVHHATRPGHYFITSTYQTLDKHLPKCTPFDVPALMCSWRRRRGGGARR